ncbi:MAG: FecR domain-containing protein [Odoribacter sp.]
MDNFDSTENNIQLLIVRYLDGIASEEEMLTLQEWMGQSEDHLSLFRQFSEYWLKAGQTQRYEVGQAWSRLDRRLKVKADKRKHRLLTRVSAYAATVILLVSLGVYFIQHQSNDLILPLVQENIEPGTKKAVLVLGMNHQVVLNGHNEDSLFNGEAVIKNEDNTLIYNNNQQTNVNEFNTLMTPRGGEYAVVLSDGTKVWLNAESELKYPMRFSGKERKVYLKGEAYFSVTKQEGSTFVVCSDDARITVLGTEFNVRNYADGVIATTLVKGSVVASHHEGEECKLVPGQQAVFGKEGMVVKTVETIFYTGWKDGFFVYEDRTLDDILKELSRWYDFTYFYENHALENILLTARLRKFDSVDQIFEILSKTGHFAFITKGKAVTVVAK